MSLVSDRLATLALTLDPVDQRRLSADISNFAETMERVSTVDFRGQAKFDEASVRAAALDLQKRTEYAVGKDFPDELIAALKGGFTVPTGGGDPLPVTLLQSDRDLSRRINFDQQLRSDTGLPIGPAGPSSLLAKQSPSLARVLAATPPLAAQLDGGAIDRQIFEAHLNARAQVGNVVASLARVNPTGDGGGDGGGSGGGGGGPVVSADIIKQIETFVTSCLPRLQPTQPSLSVGPGVCFDANCANTFNAILLASAGGTLAKAITAAIGAASAGIDAAVAAAVSSVGGWITLIVVVCVIVFSGWFASCITSRGACIHFPWWAGFGPVPFAR